jgi:hypothetical protein
MDFWVGTAKTSRQLNLRNEVIREKKMGVTKNVGKRNENNMLKWGGNVICMGDNRWPK